MALLIVGHAAAWQLPAGHGLPKARLAHRAACARALATGETEATLYTPFIETARALFDEHGIELQPYTLDEKFRQRKAETGNANRRTTVQLTTEAYSSAKIRQIRLVHIQGASGLQVLNFCIFPKLEYGLPSFAADLVTLPGGHLIALDWAPNGADWTAAVGNAAGDSEGEGSELVGRAAASRLVAAFSRHRANLPGGGDIPPAAAAFFSDCFLFSRMPMCDRRPNVCVCPCRCARA